MAARGAGRAGEPARRRESPLRWSLLRANRRASWRGQSALAIPREGPPHRRLRAHRKAAGARAAQHTSLPSSSFHHPLAPMAPPKKADKKPAAKTTKAAAKKGSKKRAKVRPGV